MKKHKEQTNVPALRFPEFREGGEWEQNTLGKLSIILRGGSPRPITDFLTTEESGLNWLKIGDVDKEAKYISHTEERVTIQALNKTREVRPGDLIMSNSMSFGRPYILEIKTCIHDGWIAITDLSNSINRDYLYYFILSSGSQSYFENSAAGGGIKNLNADIIKSLPVSSPKSKTEQKKIADCLSSLDDLITAESEQLTALKTHKTGLMQQLFPSEGETTPKLRFPEFQNDGEWFSLSIDELVEKNILFPPKDGNHGNIHPKSSDYVETGIPFVMANDLKHGKVDFLNCSFIAKHQADSLQKGFSKAGDVLLTHKGTVGEVALVERNNFPYIMLTPQVTYYRIENKGKLSNNYLKSWFLSSYFQRLLKNVSGGGTRAYIGITAQGKLVIKLPKKLTEQQKIADCLSSLDTLITTQAEKIELLKQHKKGLMQQLFPSMEGVGA